MKQLQIENITFTELKEELKKELTVEFKNLLDEVLKRKYSDDDSLMTRQQVADYFMVSLPTVHEWMNAGILKSYQIGNKRRFKNSEVQAALAPKSNRRELKKLAATEFKAPIKKFAPLIHSDLKKTNIPTIQTAVFEQLMRNR